MSKNVVIMRVENGEKDATYSALEGSEPFKTQSAAAKWLDKNPSPGTFQIVTMGKIYRGKETLMLSIVECGVKASDDGARQEDLAPEAEPEKTTKKAKTAA